MKGETNLQQGVNTQNRKKIVRNSFHARTSSCRSVLVTVFLRICVGAEFKAKYRDVSSWYRRAAPYFSQWYLRPGGGWVVCRRHCVSDAQCFDATRHRAARRGALTATRWLFTSSSTSNNLLSWTLNVGHSFAIW